MPEYETARLDYESRGKSATVVNVERPNGESLKACRQTPLTGDQVEKRSDRVGDTEGKTPGGKPERVSTKEA
ncbi:hypothetical protein, partial [Streptomyces thermoviolaceus]|uniref:hypothetical protein n=2 Tax=Streptomyces thermoviolaceus TaxID=1952 RepID=UPI001E44EEF3